MDDDLEVLEEGLFARIKKNIKDTKQANDLAKEIGFSGKEKDQVEAPFRQGLKHQRKGEYAEAIKCYNEYKKKIKILQTKLSGVSKKSYDVAVINRMKTVLNLEIKATDMNYIATCKDQKTSPVKESLEIPLFEQAGILLGFKD